MSAAQLRLARCREGYWQYRAMISAFELLILKPQGAVS